MCLGQTLSRRASMEDPKVPFLWIKDTKEKRHKGIQQLTLLLYCSFKISNAIRKAIIRVITKGKMKKGNFPLKSHFKQKRLYGILRFDVSNGLPNFTSKTQTRMIVTILLMPGK